MSSPDPHFFSKKVEISNYYILVHISLEFINMYDYYKSTESTSVSREFPMLLELSHFHQNLSPQPFSTGRQAQTGRGMGRYVNWGGAGWKRPGRGRCSVYRGGVTGTFGTRFGHFGHVPFPIYLARSPQKIPNKSKKFKKTRENKCLFQFSWPGAQSAKVPVTSPLYTE